MTILFVHGLRLGHETPKAESTPRREAKIRGCPERQHRARKEDKGQTDVCVAERCEMMPGCPSTVLPQLSGSSYKIIGVSPDAKPKRE